MVLTIYTPWIAGILHAFFHNTLPVITPMTNNGVNCHVLAKGIVENYLYPGPYTNWTSFDHSLKISKGLPLFIIKAICGPTWQKPLFGNPRFYVKFLALELCFLVLGLFDIGGVAMYIGVTMHLMAMYWSYCYSKDLSACENVLFVCSDAHMIMASNKHPQKLIPKLADMMINDTTFTDNVRELPEYTMEHARLLKAHNKANVAVVCAVTFLAGPYTHTNFEVKSSIEVLAAYTLFFKFENAANSH